MQPPLYIVGAGGIGCAVGYALSAVGVRVTFVEASRAKAEWGRANGVALDRRPALPAQFEPFDEWSPSSGATVILCTKCYDNEAFLARLPDDAILLPIQNGFDPALTNRIEGIASFISECLPERTHTRITRAGKLHLGRRAGSGQRRASAPREEREASAPRSNREDQVLDWLQGELSRPVVRRLGIRVERVADILPYKYTKLMYNAAISPLASAAGIDNGDLVWLPRARRLFFALIQENYAVLRSAGVQLGKVGPFHPDTVQRILRRPFVARAFAWAFYPTLKGSYCSMAGDLPRGRTEIDYYNRHLIDLADRLPCPLNRQVYELVKRMERERVPPDPKMLDMIEEPTACVARMGTG